MTRTMLKDDQWDELHTILRQINVYNKPNLRLTIEAMLCRIRVGCPWRDIPDYFGKWYVIYQQYRYWRITGKWHKLISIIMQDYDGE